MRRLILVISLLLLAGCTLFESPAERARRNSPDFKAGYRDGCATATSQGADPRSDDRVRDDDAYRTNPAYHSGWGTGLNACRPYQQGGPLPPDRGPIADPTPGGMP
jgi:hypothetical protein